MVQMSLETHRPSQFIRPFAPWDTRDYEARPSGPFWQLDSLADAIGETALHVYVTVDGLSSPKTIYRNPKPASEKQYDWTIVVTQNKMGAGGPLFALKDIIVEKAA